MKNPMELTGRTVMVTGAGQGIGHAVASMALELGANVVLIDRNAETLKEAVAALGEHRALGLEGNVGDEAFAADAVAQSVARFGAVHGLVNNAGITRPAMIAKMTMAEWSQVIEVNLTGCYLMLQAVGRHMIERAKAGDTRPGAIVNVSSTAGKKGSVGQVNYSAAKSGLFGMTMSAAREWGRYGIRVNSIGFGVVETPMTETVRSDRFRDKYLEGIALNRFSTPVEVAQPVCFLLSEGASYITGENLTASGGSHMQP